MRRYALRDDQWERIKDFLPGREGHVGGTAADNRLFVEAVLFRGRGMKRCLAHGRDRFELLVGAAVLANNLMRIADLLASQSSRRRRTA